MPGPTTSVGRSIGVCNPVEVPFNTENEISELIVVSELASSDEPRSTHEAPQEKGPVRRPDANPSAALRDRAIRSMTGMGQNR
jgi:hypothetical protein